MRWMLRWTLVGLLVAVGATSCLDVGDARADYDETIGKAESGDATIVVADGLASVRSFSEARTELWSQAPRLEVTLELPAGTHELTARNTLAKARWQVFDETGAEVAVEIVPEGLVTRKTVRLESPGGKLNALLSAPSVGPSPWRFAALADVQDKIDSVQDIYSRMAQDDSIEFVTFSGDLTEQGAVDELLRFQKEMETLPFPIYATLGNHELGNGEHTFQDIFGRVNYSFEHRGVRFTMLDSAGATLSARAWDLLQGWLIDGQDQPHVVVMHIAPFDPHGTRNGAWASREEAAAFSGDLGRADVDLAIYGHVHSFYAYESAGVPSYITGGGGAIPERLDGVDRHYLTIDVDPAKQQFDVGLVRVD